MNLKPLYILGAGMMLAFCLCSEEGDDNPAGTNDPASSEIYGKWKGVSMRTITYDLNNAVVSDSTKDPGSYYTLNATTFATYILTDTCITIDGPNTYTRKGDTLSYTFMGFLPLKTANVLANDTLTVTSKMDQVDMTTFAKIGTIETIIKHVAYSGTIPESNWTTTACPALF